MIALVLGLVAAVWCAASFVVAVIVGRAIRDADHREHVCCPHPDL